MKTIIENWIKDNSRSSRQAIMQHADALNASTENDDAFLSLAHVVADAQAMERHGGQADVLYNAAFCMAVSLVARL